MGPDLPTANCPTCGTSLVDELAGLVCRWCGSVVHRAFDVRKPAGGERIVDL